MPSLPTTPPEPGTYRHVLQHPRFVAIPGQTHPIRFAPYDEPLVESIGVALPGEPMRHTIFLRGRNARDRATREGWVDVTDAWEAHLRDLRPKVSTPSQRAVYEALTDDWQSKGQLVEASGISDSEWRTTIRLLEDRGLVRCNLGPRQRKDASNRAYRYKRGPRYDEALDVVDEVESG